MLILFYILSIYTSFYIVYFFLSFQINTLVLLSFMINIYFFYWMKKNKISILIPAFHLLTCIGFSSSLLRPLRPTLWNFTFEIIFYISIVIYMYLIIKYFKGEKI